MNIFKEYTENQKRAKDRIKREKDADKEKHDRMIDSARTRDTRRKNSMTESEIHVRLDHLDGDSRQKKANDVMKKHEKAGHIKYGGSTDKGVIFKAKSKAHANRLHKDLKPHATGVEFSEEKSAQDPDIKDRKGTQPAAYHKGLKKTTKTKRDAHFKKHGKKDDADASAYKDAPGDKKARKGNMPKSKYTKFVNNMMKEGTDFAAHRAKPKLSSSDQKKMAKVADMLRKEREKKAAMKEEQVDEAMGDAAHKAAVKHITDLGKKNNMTVGQQRMHIDNFPQKHDAKTRAHAKTINKNQFGGWKKGKDGKMTQEDTGSYRKDSGWKKIDKKDKTSPMDKAKQLAKKGQKGLKEASGMPKQEKLKKDHQHLSYVTHGGQKGRIQVHKDKAFAALNHYRKNNKSAQLESYEISEDADKSLAGKAAKSGISVGTLKKVYNRGVAAWKTGHRPGTTPSQWGHARVNAFITKKKKGGLNHDKDLA